MRHDRTRPIFFIFLAVMALTWALTLGCADHSRSGGEDPVVIEDPLLPPDTAPVFTSGAGGFVATGDDLLILPISLAQSISRDISG